MKNPLELVPGSKAFAYAMEDGKLKIMWLDEGWQFILEEDPKDEPYEQFVARAAQMANQSYKDAHS